MPADTADFRRWLRTPLTAHRLRDTPLRDLVRGRVTGRLAWRDRLARAALPPPIAGAITRVVRRSHLWRIEKASVADELIAHFADGLASGASADELLRDFGDADVAARLIRRAAIRNRPLAWHALKWTRRLLLVVLAFYAVVFARFFLAKPRVNVDYVAQLNVPIERVPVEQRAWPLYRQAILAFDLTTTSPLTSPIEKQIEGTKPYRDVVEATPADVAAWATLAAWLDAHADGLATLRMATTRPALGFVLGLNGSERDPALGLMFRRADEASNVKPLLDVSLPHLGLLRELAKVLCADARLAASRGDGARVVADVDAVLGIARHLNDDPIVVTQFVGVGIDHLAFDLIEALLVARPSTLTDAQLVALAHHVARVGGDAPASLVDLTAERYFFRDVVQRIYSDDGQGDGVLTSASIAALATYAPLGLSKENAHVTLELAAAAPLLSTRRAVLDENDRLMDLMATRFARPLRETTNADNPARRVDDRIGEIRASPLLKAKLLPVLLLTASLDNAAAIAERLLGRREGIEVGVALELHRRRHGEYPRTLDELTPTLLPRVPADRITGDPIKYRLIDGRPVVYSVGVDRDDDGGRPHLAGPDGPQWAAAAEWPVDDAKKPIDADWILFDARRVAPTTRASE